MVDVRHMCRGGGIGDVDVVVGGGGDGRLIEGLLVLAFVVISKAILEHHLSRYEWTRADILQGSAVLCVDSRDR